MKKVFVLFVSIICLHNVHSQTIDEMALGFAQEASGEEILYTDKIIVNSQKEQWPLLGVYFKEITYYYKWSIEYGYTPVMVSNNSVQESRNSTEYYVFDEHQKLLFYLMKYGDVEVVVKYVNAKTEFIKNTNIELLDDWTYFIDVNTHFSYDYAEKCMNLLIENLYFMWHYPCFAEEIQKIEKYCQAIDIYDNLESKTIDNAKGFYKDGSLVRIIWNQDGEKRYYVDDGKIVYVHYVGISKDKDVDMYLFNSEVFLIKIGDKPVSKNDPLYFEYIYMLPMQKEELLMQFTN